MKHPTDSRLWHTALVALMGAFWGAMMMVTLTQLLSQEMLDRKTLNLSFWLGFMLVGAVLLLQLKKIIQRTVLKLSLTDLAKQRFLKYHVFTYLIFLSFGFALVKGRTNLAFTISVALIFVTAQLGLLWLLAEKSAKQKLLSSLEAVPALFFVSGFAALIYQVVWQRVLFATFGSNIESVTVIVSVFMFGLGIGALAGGQIQKYFPTRLLECFVAVEIAIGIFGIFSIPLIHGIGRIAPHDSLLGLIFTTYLLLAFPTMLMGSTLPLLVAYLRKRYATLGAVVGKLYAYNTFGSAFASCLTVLLLFTMLGQQSTLILAACCNAITAWLVWKVCKSPAGEAAGPPAQVEEPVPTPGSMLSMSTALFLSACIGYISLSLEILWFRILGLMTANLPQAFGLMLALYLVGIACGSLKAKHWSESGRDPRAFIVRALFWMVLLAYLFAPLIGLIASSVDKQAGEVAGFIAAGLLAYFSGGIFPLLCHMGVQSPSATKAGEAVSWMYFLNIVGATLGSLVTGFVLLDRLTLSQNLVIVCITIAALLLILQGRRTTFIYSTIVLGVAAMIVLQPVLYGNLIARLQGFPPGVSAKYINENRHGIITVFADPDGDRVFGNGAYDGRFNIDPLHNKNGILRVYMLAALHPHPRRVLEIGMSAASATKVLTMYQPIQELITVEIDPGYTTVIEHYPVIASALHHPKLHLQIDDGRRWLLNHPDEKFDVITMNSIYWWRSNATNLLSYDFLKQCKSHLNPGGVVYYNTTGAYDSTFTAAHVFQHIAMVDNFVAASDSPLEVSEAQKRTNFLSFVDDNGVPVFAGPDPKYQKLLEQLVKAAPLPDLHDSALSEKWFWLITDDNMASEYKVVQSFLPPPTR